MYHHKSPLFLVCETPLHAGSGDALGIVDLPIQRERHTSFPKIESSSLKGALRQAFEWQAKSKGTERSAYEIKIHSTFGYDSAFESIEGDENHRQLKADIIKAFKKGKEFAGAMALSDARLLLFPVKSMKGVFTWITCPRVLKQLKRDLEFSEYAADRLMKALETAEEAKIASASSEVLFKKGETHSVILEEYKFDVSPDEDVELIAAWLSDTIFNKHEYWRSHLEKNLVVLSDDDFTDFVNLSTEVITRIKINNQTGTVEQGGLFNEEYLPAESVLYSLIMAAPEMNLRGEKLSADKVYSFLSSEIPDVFQLGGNSTLGKGILRTSKTLFHATK